MNEMDIKGNLSLGLGYFVFVIHSRFKSKYSQHRHVYVTAVAT